LGSRFFTRRRDRGDERQTEGGEGMGRGKLIVFEAGDASGKATQADKLFRRLLDGGYPVRKIEFPNYASQASSLIKMYLRGDFGKDPEQINPYAASTFFTVDRYASYKTEWEEYYLTGGILIADRYTTSNMVHQAAKITDQEQRTAYLQWLEDFEFNIFGLPRPDIVLFLDMPPEFSWRLMEERRRIESRSGDVVDIHEQDPEYLRQCYESALELAQRYHWHKIGCVRAENVRSIDEIHEEIYQTAVTLLT
jgi:dTMP kinase